MAQKNSKKKYYRKFVKEYLNEKAAVTRGSISNSAVGSGGGRRYRSSTQDQAQLPEKFNVSQISFESVPQPAAALKAQELHAAIGGQGHNESTPEGREAIVNLIHIPTYEAIRGKPFYSY